MQWYNVEIIKADFSYRSSCQTGKAYFKTDYLSPANNKVELRDIVAEQGDYIVITGEKQHVGVVTSHTAKNEVHEVQYKPLITMLDVNIYMDRSRLNQVSLEEWLAEQINATFRDNEDGLQNIIGMEAVPVPHTYNAVITMENNIGNLFEIVKEALLLYKVVVDFSINIQKKKLTVLVKTATSDTPVIESDLPNILNKNFTLKQADETFNKMLVYNEMDESQVAIFYMLQDGTISSEAAVDGRIVPVIPQSTYISYQENEEKTFEEAAYEQAFSSLAKEKENCLIEIEVVNGDKLVKPELLEIGQSVRIIRQNREYNTILTGKNEEKTTTLIFGAVRLELTKIIKGRMATI